MPRIAQAASYIHWRDDYCPAKQIPDAIRSSHRSILALDGTRLNAVEKHAIALASRAPKCTAGFRHFSNLLNRT
jgi:hypothetical protein